MTAPAPTSASAALEWDLAAAPMPGETVIGDRCVVAVGHGSVLAAAIDGVGHGADAAAAAHIATNTLERSPAHDVTSMIRECRRALARLGVDNVEARLIRGSEPLPASQSLLSARRDVGHSLPRLAPQTTSVARYLGRM